MAKCFSNTCTDDGICSSPCNSFSEEFEIPELPKGKRIKFILLNSWDDPHYIGLNTIEIFSSSGKRSKIIDAETNARETVGDLYSIFYSDQATSSDRQQLWSARYDKMSCPVYITAVLEHDEHIAMVRIWNYDTTRVHALRGVHDLVILLDDIMIFQGEISCAFTADNELKPLGDTILFTTDEKILEKIAENDICLIDDEVIASSLNMLNADTDFKASVPRQSTPSPPSSHRPLTGVSLKLSSPNKTSETFTYDNNGKLDEKWTLDTSCAESTANDIKVKVLHLELLENWGAPDCIGLTGIQFLSRNGVPLNCKCCITASIRSDIVPRLLNGQTLTRNREDMWLVPYSAGTSPPRITISFPTATPLIGVCFWNYNASLEMSYAGVRKIQLYFDAKPYAQIIELRKAPGFVFFDFVQDIFFNQYLPPPLPEIPVISGFIYQVRLLSTWGDEFYIGLNGIELYDENDELVELQPQNIAAFPESVNILPGVNGDPRTCENLINGINETTCASHMWLTPILPNRCVRVFIVFDYPMAIIKIILYNYTKTPERGVRHVSVSVDDLIVFSGEVPASTTKTTAKLPIMLNE
uniref:DUF4457 domain-containing protein n=1 Tax=Syphacia muris TaxID=451379 RepID=A0A0N5AIG6_9BILA